MESLMHLNLITHMKRWISTQFTIDPFLIYDSLPRKNNFNKCPRLPGGEPDVFYEERTAMLLIIGEAKTPSDIANQHSLKQYRAYLSYCENSGFNSYLVFAVPINYKAQMTNLLNRRYNNRNSKINFIVVGFTEVQLAENQA